MSLNILRKNTELNADCVEFCTQRTCCRQLAIGMYELNEKTQQRHGRLLVASVEEEAQSGVTLVGEREMATAGIFDMSWVQTTATDPYLALACSTGKVSLVACNQHQGPSKVAGEVVCFQDSMAASISPQPTNESSAVQQLASSSSRGELALIQVTNPDLRLSSVWKGHDLEAWYSSFDHWQVNVLYSGGDDCAFKGWDVRTAPCQPIFCNRRSHGAGVCCIASNPHREHSLVTGSYDEKIRVWDKRNTCKPVALSEVGVGGGVWRLKWHPRNRRYLLAACMHNGFAVLRSEAEDSLEIAYDFPHQKTLGYGADWCSDERLPVVATASFYERLICIWRPPIRDLLC